jgi:hypothetical protein
MTTDNRHPQLISPTTYRDRQFSYQILTTAAQHMSNQGVPSAAIIVALLEHFGLELNHELLTQIAEMQAVERRRG